MNFLEDYAEDVSKKSVTYAKYAKRKTVKEEDIALACGTPKATSADGQKHDLFDVIKNVFESASEGKGIEEIIKSFKKM